MSTEYIYGQYAVYESEMFGPEEVMIYEYYQDRGDQGTYFVRFANSEDYAEVPAERVHS